MVLAHTRARHSLCSHTLTSWCLASQCHTWDFTAAAQVISKSPGSQQQMHSRPGFPVCTVPGTCCWCPSDFEITQAVAVNVPSAPFVSQAGKQMGVPGTSCDHRHSPDKNVQAASASMWCAKGIKPRCEWRYLGLRWHHWQGKIALVVAAGAEAAVHVSLPSQLKGLLLLLPGQWQHNLRQLSPPFCLPKLGKKGSVHDGSFFLRDAKFCPPKNLHPGQQPPYATPLHEVLL